MKGKLTSFLAGMLTVVLLMTLTVSALAADGSLSLTVNPIRVLVNGEVFQPKDAQGNDALVFTYNGTTYAPLRALAEAYGLEVGYDAANKIATVNVPETGTITAPAPSMDFASQWTVAEKPVSDYGSEKIFTAVYSGSMSISQFKSWWKSMDASDIEAWAEQMALDAQSLVPGYTVTMYFSYGSYGLGTAYAMEGYQFSNFNQAGVWIK